MTPTNTARNDSENGNLLTVVSAPMEKILSQFRTSFTPSQWKAINRFGLGSQIQPAFLSVSANQAVLANGIVLKVKG